MSDQETVNVTLNGLLDEAIGELTPFQKWAVERNFKKHPQNRRAVLHAVELHLAKTDEKLMTVMDGEDFGADTPIKTTVAGKGELLQVILENLPAILEAILKIIGLFSVILLACMLLPSSAIAQDGVVSLDAGTVVQAGPSCANGVCSLGTCQRPAVEVVQRVATQLGTVVNAARPMAIVTTTRQRIHSRPVRSLFAGVRPVKRVVAAFRRR